MSKKQYTKPRDEWRLTTWPDGHQCEKHYVDGQYVGEWRTLSGRVFQDSPTRRNCQLCEASVPASSYASHIKWCAEYQREQADGARIGAAIARLLQLRRSRDHADRYDTTQGTKTDLGLYRTVKGVIDGTVTVD